MTYKAYYYLKLSGRAPLAEYLDELKLKNREATSDIFSAIKMLVDEKCFLPPPFLKHIWKKVYELRIQHQKNQYRVFYFIYLPGKIILLDGYTKKTQKIPPRILRKIQLYYFDYLIHRHEKEFETKTAA